MKMRIKKGDQVEVITGKEQNKGKRGEVIKVLPKENRLVVQGVNLLTKHQKQVQSEGKTINPGIASNWSCSYAVNATDPHELAFHVRVIRQLGFAKNVEV